MLYSTHFISRIQACRRIVTEEQVKYARDLCTTAHSVIKLPSFMLQGTQQLCITIYLTVLILFRGTTSYYSNCRSCYSIGGRSPNSKCTQDMCSIYMVFTSSTSARCDPPACSRRIAYTLRRGIDVDRIAAMTQGAANKRRCGEMGDEVEPWKIKSLAHPRRNSSLA
jgi:hypothetical protein